MRAGRRFFLVARDSRGTLREYGTASTKQAAINKAYRMLAPGTEYVVTTLHNTVHEGRVQRQPKGSTVNDRELEDFRDELRTNLEDIYVDLASGVRFADRRGLGGPDVDKMRMVKERFEVMFQELDFLASLPTDDAGELAPEDVSLLEAFEIFDDVNRSEELPREGEDHGKEAQ